MSILTLTTIINAPIERVFDLSRSIDLHKLSMKETNEEAIAGKMTGLIDLHETVTWRAKHLGFYQQLQVEIYQMQRPYLFADRMVKGIFAKMEHIHTFESIENGTKMTDRFEFLSPLGILGRWVNVCFLDRYMTNFLHQRNQVIKEIAEGEEWRKIL